LNPACIELATKAALALHSHISPITTFDRKHYFYPDLPHGFQITQFFHPFATEGKVTLYPHNGVDSEMVVRIQQIQIEQDSAKTVQGIGKGSLVDLNRAGVGILEIVTRPDLRSARDTLGFLKKLQHLLWHVGVSIPDMDDVFFSD
jgi:aspartyl-tRNA(Asn)/glutamyl-tRNA(Gln) amidotransferase subunit B